MRTACLMYPKAGSEWREGMKTQGVGAGYGIIQIVEKDIEKYVPFTEPEDDIDNTNGS